ncbi:MAG: hypothetical protein HYX25_05660 [Candidatus Solibacter usitatus]|jgi:hypothetical protein|nr:hypothetical protein [Candidatus Solibacter usitatus]
MKKLMIAMLSLSLLTGLASVSFGRDDDKKMEKKEKKGKKKKADKKTDGK